jgi:hypothetical protein
MMDVLFALVALPLLPMATGDDQRTPNTLNGKVLDVFGDNQVLISFGSADGARKGLVAYLYRLDPRPDFVGMVELTAVGTRHSVGRLSKKLSHVRENDLVAWINPNPVFPEIPRLPGQWERGGAIIDLTLPKGPK